MRGTIWRLVVLTALLAIYPAAMLTFHFLSPARASSEIEVSLEVRAEILHVGPELQLEAWLALDNRSLEALGPLIEEDAILMHSVMMTSHPPLYYWMPATLEIIHAVQRWRADGLPVYFTIDAGPNVHLICESRHAETVAAEARALPGVRQILQSGVGGPARLLHAD